MKSFRSLAAGLGLATACVAATAGSLVINPAASVVDITINPNFDLAVRGQAYAESVLGGGFNLAYDPTILQLTGVTIAPIWEFLPLGGNLSVPGTVVDASFASFVTPRTGNFDVAVLHFTAIGLGVSAITPSAAPTFVFSDVGGNPIVSGFVGGTVTVVPEPGTLAMMLAGFGVLSIGLRKRC